MANEIAKGVQALNKGMAMFAWMEPVRDAFLEVGDLQKELETLYTRITRAEDAAEQVEADLAKLCDEKTGADAEAAALIATAKEEAAVIKADAGLYAEQTAAEAQIVLAELRIQHEDALSDHIIWRKGIESEKDEVEATLVPLREELAAIKAKFSD